MVWTSSNITWYQDGTQTCQKDGGAVGTPSTPMFLQFSLQVRSDYGVTGAPSGDVIDWVRVTDSATGNLLFYDGFKGLSAPSLYEYDAASNIGGVVSTGKIVISGNASVH